MYSFCNSAARQQRKMNAETDLPSLPFSSFCYFHFLAFLTPFVTFLMVGVIVPFFFPARSFVAEEILQHVDFFFPTD